MQQLIDDMCVPDGSHAVLVQEHCTPTEKQATVKKLASKAGCKLVLGPAAPGDAIPSAGVGVCAVRRAE
eukprot:4569683-Alexandrium_andersonii.AAC.1